MTDGATSVEASPAASNATPDELQHRLAEIREHHAERIKSGRAFGVLDGQVTFLLSLLHGARTEWCCWVDGGGFLAPVLPGDLSHAHHVRCSSRLVTPWKETK